MRATLSREQVQRARLTSDYDGLYEVPASGWTSDMFVEAIYRDVSRAR